ncbi:formyltransferase family protein [Alphaproteobacteria bacterium]|nr:formyltransferase family protein [Alphaproteobacteria bacterium]
MKIILMGQQAFGKSTLEKFHKETDHEVVAVYCAPDKEGKPLDPVKEYAVSESLPVFQPSNFKDKEVLEQIKSHNADLCVMAYVIIFVPEEARDIPKHGSICFHPSLLPLHRGPSSINWPIIMGSKKTGLTIFYPNDGLDEGEVLLQKEVEIGEDETLGDVYFSKIFPLGVDACVEAANLLDAGNAPKNPQDDTKSTYESWCRKADARIDWKKPGIEVYNLIRGCNPQPGAWAEFMNEEFVFLDTKFSSEQSAEHFPGQIMEINKEDVKIAVKGGFLIVSRFKSKEQGKLYVKDMNTAVLTEGDLFS